MLSPLTAVITAIRKTFDFDGRSRRSEFWWFFLFASILFVIVENLEGAFFSQPDFKPRDVGWGAIIDSFKLSPITQTTDYILSFMLVSLGTRRLHDLGRSGWPIVTAFAFSIIWESVHPMRNPEMWKDTDIPSMSFEAYFYPSNYEIMSPWYSLVIGFTISLYLYCFIAALFDGKSKTNRFGESPKYNQGTDVFD